MSKVIEVKEDPKIKPSVKPKIKPSVKPKIAEEKKESKTESKDKGLKVYFSTGQNNVSNKLKVPASNKTNSRYNSSASRGSQNSAGSKGSAGFTSKGNK